jgi:hypothetical protein
VLLVLLVQLGQQEILAQQARLGLLVLTLPYLDRQVPLAILVLRVQKDPLVIQALQGLQEPQERLEPLVLRETQEIRVQRVLLAHRAIQGLLVILAQQDHKVQQETQDRQVRLVPLEILVLG